MKTGLLIIAFWSLFLLAAATTIGGIFDIYPARFYLFTIPFLLQAATALLLAIVGLVFRKLRSTAFWLVLPLHGLLFATYYYAVSKWPGGDDGPGMAWMLLIGAGSCVAAAVALATGGTIAVKTRRSRNDLSNQAL